MPIPIDVQGGTRPRDRGAPRRTGASQPDVNDRGGKKGIGRKYAGSLFEIDALNPPFDPRMRRIGSPLNMTSRIKRGWIQSKNGDHRVNFLFNPSSLAISSAVFDGARLDKQIPSGDTGLDADYPSMGTKTGVQLLYDRTYEVFSPPKNGEAGFANRYGVWADVAAWYVFLGMLDEMPTSWENSMIVNPMHRTSAYLFVGPNMCYYGWVTDIAVTYSHWTQNMVPSRCAVNIGFEVIPHDGADVYKGARPDITIDVLPGVGWVGDWVFTPDGLADPGRGFTGGASGGTDAGGGGLDSFLGFDR